MVNLKSIIIFSLAILFSVTFAADKEAEKLLDNVQKTYEKLDNVCADFNQTFYWKLTDETQTVAGTICAKNGDKFRIETPDQYIVTNGQVLWTLDKLNNKVIIDHAENANNDNPFIKDFMNKYISEYSAQMASDRSDNSSDCILLKSKSGDHFVPQLWLWINKRSNLIGKIVQVDLNENTTTFEMNNIDTKPKLTNSEFNYKVADGTEIIDMR